MASDKIPVWLDCDPGHDDAFAILIAAHHPSLNLLGITTVHGNASLEHTTKNAGGILEAIGRPDIPVYPGCSKPFCRPAIYAPNIHGESGLGGTELLPQASKPPVTDKNAIVAMRDALMAQPKGIPWLIATGTLTNVALLFATFPEVAEHIQGLSLMGGGVGEGFTASSISKLPGQESRIGNVTNYAEFNVYCDPEASQSIFSNPIVAPKTTIIALDLTHQVLATSSVQSRVLHGTDDQAAAATGTPTVLRRLFHDLLVFFAGTYRNSFGISAGPPLHDPLAVAVVLSTLNPIFTRQQPDQAIKFDDKDGERFGITVVTDGVHGMDLAITGQLGRSVASPSERRGVAIPRGVDLEAFWTLVMDCLQRADDWNAQRT